MSCDPTSPILSRCIPGRKRRIETDGQKEDTKRAKMAMSTDQEKRMVDNIMVGLGARIDERLKPIEDIAHCLVG